LLASGGGALQGAGEQQESQHLCGGWQMHWPFAGFATRVGPMTGLEQAGNAGFPIRRSQCNSLSVLAQGYKSALARLITVEMRICGLPPLNQRTIQGWGTQVIFWAGLEKLRPDAAFGLGGRKHRAILAGEDGAVAKFAL
jgi:hypothetical protein